MVSLLILSFYYIRETAHTWGQYANSFGQTLKRAHYLQSCSLHQQARQQIWPTCVSLKTKLWGCWFVFFFFFFFLFCLLVGCLTSQQHASVSQGRICSDKFTCCHTEIEVADPTFYLTQSQYTDTGPTSPSADPRTPGAWQGSHWSANF